MRGKMNLKYYHYCAWGHINPPDTYVIECIVCACFIAAGNEIVMEQHSLQPRGN